MSSRTKVTFDPLDPDSVDRLITYFDNEWVKKLTQLGERVSKRLTDEGFEVAFNILAEHIDSGATFSSLSVRHDGTGIYTIYGGSVALFFLEFGSGVRGQGSFQNEWSGEHGYGPGTYPGQVNALNPNGWLFPTGEVDSKGKPIYKRTRGHPVYRPFNLAYKTMLNHIAQIVNEEFNPSDFT